MATVDVEAPQEYQALGENSSYVKNASAEVRMGFVRKVYGILSAQLLLTVAVAAQLQQMPMEWLKTNIWLLQASLVGSLVAVLAISCCPSVGKSYPTNYLALFAFTLCEAILVGMVSACYTSGTVCLCAGMTAVIFLSMTFFAWTSKSDFTGFGPYLLGGLLALFVFGLAVPFMPGSLAFTGKLYAGLGVLIFTLYIVYDTQLILGEFKGHAYQFSIDEYVLAALNLYTDLINLFLDLLRIVGDSR